MNFSHLRKRTSYPIVTVGEPVENTWVRLANVLTRLDVRERLVERGVWVEIELEDRILVLTPEEARRFRKRRKEVVPSDQAQLARAGDV